MLNLKEVNGYGLFGYSYDYLHPLFGDPPVYIENLNSSGHKQTRKSKNKGFSIQYDEFVGVKGAIENQMYGKDIVPYYVVTNNYNFSTKRQPNHTGIDVILRFISIDDEGYHVKCPVNNEHERQHAYKQIFEFIDTYTHLVSESEFQEYFTDRLPNSEISFD